MLIDSFCIVVVHVVFLLSVLSTFGIAVHFSPPSPLLFSLRSHVLHWTEVTVYESRFSRTTLWTVSLTYSGLGAAIEK